MYNDAEEDRLEKIRMYVTLEHLLTGIPADQDTVSKPEEKERQKRGGRKRVGFKLRSTTRIRS
jgi:hypothetical protein